MPLTLPTSGSALTGPSHSQLHTPKNTAIMYAHPSGDNANHGLTWAAAKKDILGAYDALPAAGGEIHFADSTYVDSANTTRGLWIMGPSDPNYASPPAGWRHQKALRLVGVGTLDWVSTAHMPAANMIGGSGSDNTKPTLWLSATSAPLLFENVKMQYPAVAMKIGINSNGVTSTDGAAGIAFNNCHAALNSVAGNGPVIEFGYVYSGTAVDVAITSGWHLVSPVFNGASSERAIDGANVTGLNPGAGNAVNFQIGGFDGTLFAVEDIGEVIVYNSALSAANRNTIGNYLATKWAGSWSPGA